MNKLFAVDFENQNVVVSESLKGSDIINQIEKVSRSDNELLYQAVKTLTMVSSSPVLNTKIFKAMDKVCQLVYMER
jgi:hypothetical protein